MKNIKYIIVALCLFLTLLSFSAPPAAEAGQIVGRVVTQGDIPLEGVKVKIGTGFYVWTDASGYFNFGLLSGNITFSFYKEGYLDSGYIYYGLGTQQQMWIGWIRLILANNGGGGTYCGPCAQALPQTPGQPHS